MRPLHKKSIEAQTGNEFSGTGVPVHSKGSAEILQSNEYQYYPPAQIENSSNSYCLKNVKHRECNHSQTKIH